MESKELIVAGWLVKFIHNESNEDEIIEELETINLKPNPILFSNNPLIFTDKELKIITIIIK